MRKLFLSSSVLLVLISFSTAYAEQIKCKPVEVGLIKSVAIEATSQGEGTMRIEYMDSSTVSGGTEYGDDVDAVFYFSETLNAQLEYSWAEMQKVGHARGSFYRDFEGASKREIIEVFCRTLGF